MNFKKRKDVPIATGLKRKHQSNLDKKFMILWVMNILLCLIILMQNQV